jgi:hypothetical protein
MIDHTQLLLVPVHMKLHKDSQNLHLKEFHGQGRKHKDLIKKQQQAIILDQANIILLVRLFLDLRRTLHQDLFQKQFGHILISLFTTPIQILKLSNGNKKVLKIISLLDQVSIMEVLLLLRFVQKRENFSFSVQLLIGLKKRNPLR